jgi:hypothetical protein
LIGRHTAQIGFARSFLRAVKKEAASFGGLWVEYFTERALSQQILNLVGTELRVFIADFLPKIPVPPGY